MPKKLKAGEAGAAVNYVTRNKAIRLLQVTLKDFRRLCILKGIYPRDPPKKKKGKDKTYYHVKDVKFLRHEPLLAEMRAEKTRLAKQKRAEERKDYERLKRLKASKSAFSIDHIIKERYPTFLDALRDLDDALCMVHLFAMLPTKTVAFHDSAISTRCIRLSREFQSYVAHVHGLRKSFVSIKGFYYQAEVQSQQLTWLVPHKFTQELPSDVDYRVLLTFLDLYMATLEFVMFKLYADIGVRYPLHASRDANDEGLSVFRLEPIVPKAEAAPAAASAGSAAVKSELKDATPQIAAVLKKIERKHAKAEGGAGAAAAAAADASAPMTDVDGGDAAGDEKADTALFAKIDSEQNAASMTAAQKDEMKVRKLFAGLTFYLAREVPADSVEFVILNGGGAVIRENVGDAARAHSPAITHHIVDRPPAKGAAAVDKSAAAREHVQPQWVYDSFNTRALLPTAPYAPGVVPPPHLSPFVDNDKEGYVPNQAKVLAEWGAAATGAADPNASAAAAHDNGDDGDDDGGDDDFDGGDDSDNDHDLEQDELDAEEAAALTVDPDNHSGGDGGGGGGAAAAATAAERRAYERRLANELNSGTAASAGAKGKGKGKAPASASASAADMDDADSGAAADADGDADMAATETDSKAPAAKKGGAAAGSAASAGAAAKGKGSAKRKAGDAAAAKELELAKIMMPKRDARLYQRMQHGIQKKKAAADALEERRLQIEAEESGAPAPAARPAKKAKRA